MSPSRTNSPIASFSCRIAANDWLPRKQHSINRGCGDLQQGCTIYQLCNRRLPPLSSNIRRQLKNQCAKDFKSLFAAIMAALNWRVMQPKLSTGLPNTVQDGIANWYRGEVIPIVFPAGSIEKPSDDGGYFIRSAFYRHLAYCTGPKRRPISIHKRLLFRAALCRFGWLVSSGSRLLALCRFAEIFNVGKIAGAS